MTSGGTRRERIWFDDPIGFMRDDRLSKFLPVSQTPLQEQLNAILRLAIYYAAIVFVFRGSFAVLYVPLLTAVVTYFVYTADRTNEERMVNALESLDVVRDPRTREPCTRPTIDNPYMNVLISDYSSFPERPKACDITNESVQRRAEKLQSHNLYKDSDDIFDRNASSRQFYSNPSTTIPNEQNEFAKWLYETPPTCKDGDTDMCAAHMFKYAPGM
jgi:hypothetical protein